MAHLEENQVQVNEWGDRETIFEIRELEIRCDENEAR